MKRDSKKTKTEVKKNKLDELKTKQIFLIIIMLITVAGICFGFTYVWVLMNEKEEIKEEAKFGSLEVVVEGTNSSSIVMDDPYPMNEAGGLSTDPYKFTLKNTGNYDMNYSLNLVEDTDAMKKCAEESNGFACKTVSVDSIRYSIKKNGVIISTGLLKDSRGVIDMGTIPASSEENENTVNYELKLWVDFDTSPEEVMNAQFFGKIDVRTQTEK